MSRDGRLWRAIIWVERFLPTPTAVLPKSERAAVARRRGALVPLIVLPMVVVPMLLRERQQFGPMLRNNRVLFEDLILVFAVMCVAAAVIAGVVTWRREKRRHGGGQ